MDKVIYQCGEIRVEPANRRLARADKEIALEPKAFAVLLELLARHGELMTRNELLDAVWGHQFVTPTTLNRVITLLRRVFADDADKPRYIQTVHGSGYRYIGPIERLEAPTADTHARFEPPPIARLPARLEALIGRVGELEQLHNLFIHHRAVTILGTGGMGKTQCALEFARQCVESFPDGIWFFDLSPLQRAQEWLAALAAALSIPAQDKAQLLVQVRAALVGRRALLVIDNCDRLASPIGAIVIELLRGSDALKILATSQQRLNFVGEQLMWMPPLAMPDVEWQRSGSSIAQVAATPAVALLAARASTVQPAFALTSTNVVAIVEICRHLDGMPLALELAAAQFALLAPEAILQRLEHRFRFLVSDSAGREVRHQTLLALVDWSFALLSTDEQLLLCWLGVFLQGWTMDAVEDLGIALGFDVGKVIELLSGLVVKSLVVVDPTLTPPRYRLLETVRAFALEKLAASGAEYGARNAHLMHLLRIAEQTQEQMLGAQARSWIARLSHEHANIGAALEWAKTGGANDDAALRLAGSMMLYGKIHGEMRLTVDWMERALRGVALVSSRARGRVLLGLGVLRFYISGAEAEQILLDAVEIAEQANDRWAQGYAYGYQACHLARMGRTEDAATWVVKLETLTETLADDGLSGLAGLAKGLVQFSNGDMDNAVTTLSSVHRLGTDLHQHHFIDVYIGLALFGLARWEQAASAWCDALSLGIEIRHVRGAAGSVEGAAYIAIQLGKPTVGARLLGAAEAIRERTTAPLLSFWITHHQHAVDAARAELSVTHYQQLWDAGARERDEVVFNEALTYLRKTAEGAPLKSPDGS